MKALLAFVLAAACAFAIDAAAQSFPSKPIRLVVTYPPGGGADLMARLIAPKMAESLGQPVVVENKPGAGGQIGAGEVARAAPDGYTLMLDAANHAVNPSLYPSLPYDSAKAFQPISAPGSVSERARRDVFLRRQGRAGADRHGEGKPGTIAFASSGNGSAQHLAGELFRQKANVDITHIPYKGGGPALNDVIGGQVPMFFANMASGSAREGRKASRPRDHRFEALARAAGGAHHRGSGPSGIRGVRVERGVRARGNAGAGGGELSEAISKAMQSQEVRDRVAALGGEIAALGPAETARFIREQTELWSRVVRAANIRPE
jgi:tripartite-type tricarboxylate transporter receptor subunit TctC